MQYWEQEAGGTDNFNVFPRGSVNQREEGSQLASLVNWINAVLPDFNLPLETSEEELRACLSDGLGSDSMNEPMGVQRFLVALDELGLSGFELSDLQQEYYSFAHCVGGGSASIASSFIFTPSERIKQQMQVGSHYRNCWDVLVGIIRNGGLSSLYAGWRAVLCRNIPHSNSIIKRNRERERRRSTARRCALWSY